MDDGEAVVGDVGLHLVLHGLFELGPVLCSACLVVVHGVWVEGGSVRGNMGLDGECMCCVEDIARDVSERLEFCCVGIGESVDGFLCA